MKIILNGKTYFKAGKFKSSLLRRVHIFQERHGFKDMKAKDLDDVVEFICDVFDNQFTPEEFYDGVDIKDLNATVSEVVNGVNKQQTRYKEGCNERIKAFFRKIGGV